MKKHNIKYSFFLAVLILFTSCSQENKKYDFLKSEAIKNLKNKIEDKAGKESSIEEMILTFKENSTEVEKIILDVKHAEVEKNLIRYIYDVNYVRMYTDGWNSGNPLEVTDEDAGGKMEMSELLKHTKSLTLCDFSILEKVFKNAKLEAEKNSKDVFLRTIRVDYDTNKEDDFYEITLTGKSIKDGSISNIVLYADSMGNIEKDIDAEPSVSSSTEITEEEAPLGEEE